MILCALMIVKWAEWSCEDGKASSMRNVYVSNHADFSIQLAIPHSKSYYIPYMNFSHHKVPGMHPLDLSFLPGVYFSDALAIPQNTSATIPEDDQHLDTSNLVKRGCSPSKSAPEICTGAPTVDFLGTKIRQHGKVGKLDSLFYSDLGAGNAMAQATDWYRKNVCKGHGSVVFNQPVDQEWYDAQVKVLWQQSMPKVDVFQKWLSQAFAEASQGTVYFFKKKRGE